MNRKKFIQAVAALSLGVLGSGVLASAEEAQPANPPFAGKKILVAYFSWSGNTKTLAEKIHASIGGELFEIVPAVPYPTEYRKCTEQAKKEIAEKFRPALKAVPANIGEYDVIFVGSPNWWGTYAPPVATLLDEPSFAGKTVVPFFTNGGGGMQNCESDMRRQLSASTVLKALTVSGTSAGRARTAKTVDAWLQEISR